MPTPPKNPQNKSSDKASANPNQAAENKENVLNSELAQKIGKVLRLTSLSVLFAGCAAIVFAAITLVKIGEAKGMTITAAATANAPIFLHFSKVVAATGVILLIAEAMDSFVNPNLTRPKIIQYIATALCCLCAFSFAFFVAPQMEQMLSSLPGNASIQQSFHSLHETSRILFSGIIIFAWVSLIVPVLYETKS